MTRLVLARLARALVTIAAVAVLAVLLAELAPGTAAERAARAAGVLPPPDAPVPEALREDLLDRVAHAHELDAPLAVRVVRYVAGLAVGDFGISWRDGRPVRASLRRAAPPSLAMALVALLVSACLGLALAVAAAARPGGLLDRVAAALAAAAFAIPPVWLAILLLRGFAPGEPSWTLATLTLAAVPTFVIARHARAALVAARDTPWARAAAARGASVRRVLGVHGLAASAPSLVALAPPLVAYLIGATVVVEEVFGIRGLGALLVDAAARGDAPVVAGVAVIAAAAIALTSAAADVAAHIADPRLREADGDA